MTVNVVCYDSAVHSRTQEEQVDLLNDAVESGEAAYIVHALGVIARARGMTAVARDAGMTREGLYKALDESGNPSFATVIKVSRALGYRLSIERAEP